MFKIKKKTRYMYLSKAETPLTQSIKEKYIDIYVRQN